MHTYVCVHVHLLYAYLCCVVCFNVSISPRLSPCPVSEAHFDEMRLVSIYLHTPTHPHTHTHRHTLILSLLCAVDGILAIIRVIITFTHLRPEPHTHTHTQIHM